MIVKQEIRKIIHTPALWVFVAIALVVNTVYIFSSIQSSTIDYYYELNKTTGTVYDEGFLDRLHTVPQPSEDEDFEKNLLYLSYEAAAMEANEPFEAIRGEILRKQIPSNRFLSSSPLAQKIIDWKYNLLESVIDKKIAAKDSEDVYFAYNSEMIQEMIFTNYHRLLGAEIVVLFILMMLYAIGFENMFNTESVVYTTRRGRKSVIQKGVAALISALILGLIVYALSSLLMFSVNDFSGVWSQNISAQYNLMHFPQWGEYPFLTWESMTVGVYAIACAGVLFLHGFLAGIFAAVFALMIRNVYIAFCAIFAVSFLHFILIFSSNLPAFLFDVLLIPTVTQILYCQWWFTDGGPYALLPHFEIFYPIICIVLLLPILLFAYRHFRRKEFV